jgi:transketolase
MNLGDINKKWEAFGWNVLDVDGHNVADIYEKIIDGKKSKDKPTMIILNTIKGKGISFIEEMGYKNHSMNVNESQKSLALNELKGEE